MAVKDLTVDDILDDIKRKASRAAGETLSSMEQVDKIVKEILEQRQSEELRREKRTVTLKEKMSLEEDVKVTTKTITDQFFRLSPEQTMDIIKPQTVPAVEPLHLSPTQELHILKVQKNQQLKRRDTSSIELSQEVAIQRVQKYDNLKKAANNQHLQQDMKNITSHFGNFKMNDKSLDESYNKKAAMNKDSYRELKMNRNRVVDAFVLDPKKEKAPNMAESVLEQEIQKSETAENSFEISKEFLETATGERRAYGIRQVNVHEPESSNDLAPSLSSQELDSQGLDYEYNDISQKAEVEKNLRATLKTVSAAAVIFGVLSAVSVGLLFTSFSKGEVTLFGFLKTTPLIYSLVGLVLTALAAIFGRSVFSNAFASLGERKPDKDILYAAALLLLIVTSAVFTLNPSALLKPWVISYVPLLIIILLVNFVAKVMGVKKILRSFKRISSGETIYAVTPVMDRSAVDSMTSGLGDVLEDTMLMRNVNTDFVQNFLAHSFGYDESDKMSQKMLSALFPVYIIVFGAALFFSRDIFAAVSVASAVPILLLGFITAMMVTFPIVDAAPVVEHFTGDMPDYDAINCFCEADAMLLEAIDFFPAESVLLHGIKTFQGKRIDNAIVDAASVLCAANSVLKSIFLSIIANRTDLLKPVDTIIYEDSMGISSWVNEKRVLIGNRALMINHSIAVPKEEYEKKYSEQGHELIYLSCEGELSAAFVVEFVRSGSADDLIDLLDKNEIAVVVKTVDACVTNELLAKVFDIDTSMIKILPARLHRVYEEQHEPLKHIDGGMPNNGGAFSMAVLIAVCKRLYGCIKIGKLMHIFSAVCGILLLAASLVLKLPALAGGIQLLLVMLVFGLVYWIYEKNIKL